MRRITTWALSTLSALVLLFSYHTSTSSDAARVVAVGGVNGASGSGTPDGTGASGGAAGGAATPTPTPTQADGSSSGTTGPSGGDGTYTGDAVMTRFGPVQVEITVSGGRITKSVVTQVPWTDRRDQEINSYAVPVLGDEAVQAQSSQIDMVSGATFTSEGYIQSLQSAIDKAHL
jgi:uncharacterized protein with FMN-binding domain